MKARQCADSAADTQLANFFAQAALMLTDIQPGTVCWLHSKGLLGDWDAPHEYRLQFAGEEDPDPPTFTRSPIDWVDVETVDPDVLLGLQQAASSQVRLLDEFLGAMIEIMDSSSVWDSTLFLLTAP
jgi:hypothetical protein